MNALAKKLLIKSGKSWLFYNAPESYLNLLAPLPDGVTIHFEAKGTFDGVQLFSKNSSELNQSLKIIAPLLHPDTIVWICYPKKSSGIASDLTMTGNWDVLETYNLEGVAAVSVNDIWTAVRARAIGQAKRSNTANAAIQQNDYSAYIDVDNKRVTLPDDIEQALNAAPEAMDLYQRLAYSHKKEYVLWIITAKQQKTRTERVVKMIGKLLAKKKNPTDK